MLKRPLLMLMILGLSLLAANPLQAQARYAASASLDEYLVKGSLLVNIPKFVNWPASALPASPKTFTIAVLGMNPFSDLLDDLAKVSRIQGRTVNVKYVKRLRDARDCQLLFISVSEAGRLPALLKELGNRKVLTVSDIRDFSRKGGMVGLVIVDNRVQFEVNQASIRKAGLKVGAQLLQLAHQVVPEEGK